MTTTARSFKYRYDLDGLRGIAIGLVVIYHVFVGRVSGGVDVFLLLSGYFFLGSQLRYMDKPNASFNPWWPIWRTLRRLVPALVVTVGATLLLVKFFTPQLLRTELMQQVTATLFYRQNWELARQNADYAAASAETSPLQHLWSMAVQGQFYLLAILFALVLGAVLRGIGKHPALSVTRVAGPILVVITVASFIYASRFGLDAPASNYYDTFSRAWEITLGGALAVYGSRIVVPERFQDLVTGVGLFAICITGIVIADTSAYPGPLTLLPLGGAALIVVGGGGKISRAMASKQARWLGDIAYSLYLWHWPLLILSTSYLNLHNPPWWLGVIIIAASLGLAHLTHTYVEVPLRQHRKRPTRDDLPTNKALNDLRKNNAHARARAAGGALVAAGVVAMLCVQPLWMGNVRAGERQTLDPVKHPGVMAYHGAKVPTDVPVQPDPILVGGVMPPVSTTHCFIAKEATGDYFTETRVTGEPCIFGDPNAEFTVYLVGGSHAEQWSSGLDKLGREMHFKLVPLLRQDCPIEIGPDLTVTPECAQWGELALQKIIDNDADLVISNTTRPQSMIGYGPDAVPPGYVGFWDQLAQHSIPFLGLRDNPWGFDDEGRGREFDQCYVSLEDNEGCGMKFDEVYQPVDPAAAILANYTNMKAVDTSSWFCKDGICPVIIGNVFVYRDMHHISNAFADSAMPLLKKEIEPFMKGEKVQQQAPAPLADAASSSAAASSSTTSSATTTNSASTNANDGSTTPAVPATDYPVPYPMLAPEGAV